MQWLRKLFIPAAAAPAAVSERDRKVNDLWSVSPEAKAAQSGWYWLQHPLVLARVNRLISGHTGIDAYGRLQAWLERSGRALPLGPCISLGCGFGGLERDLARRGLVAEMDAYDLAEGAIAEARRLADAAGLGGIRYHVADIETQVLPPAHHDAVFAHSAVHHVERLEALFEAIRRTLRPDGVFHLNEFVGPSRFQWTDAQIDLINGWLDTLPDRLRRTPNGPKPAQERPSIAQMIAMDPTESVRSADIRDVLRRYFRVIDDRPFGGALLHNALAEIAQNFRADAPEDVAHLQRLFALEDEMMANGTIGSDFAVLTAVPPESAIVSFARAGRPDIVLQPSEGQAVPGLDLTVSGLDTMYAGNADHYVFVGQSACAVIGRALAGRTPRRILDLPCGHGRVTRALRARFPEASITVSDLDAEGVAFCAAQFNARPTPSVRDFNRLDLAERFDLIWVGSLITHLPPDQTKAFFAAMARHMAPDAVLVVSSHGPAIIPRLRQTGYGLTPDAVAAVIEEYERTGFGFADYPGGEEYGVALTNEHYGISLINEAWLRAALPECGLAVRGYEAEAWDHHHDVVIAALRAD